MGRLGPKIVRIIIKNSCFEAVSDEVWKSDFPGPGVRGRQGAKFAIHCIVESLIHCMEWVGWLIHCMREAVSHCMRGLSYIVWGRGGMPYIV